MTHPRHNQETKAAPRERRWNVNSWMITALIGIAGFIAQQVWDMNGRLSKFEAVQASQDSDIAANKGDLRILDGRIRDVEITIGIQRRTTAKTP